MLGWPLTGFDPVPRTGRNAFAGSIVPPVGVRIEDLKFGFSYDVSQQGTHGYGLTRGRRSIGDLQDTGLEGFDIGGGLVAFDGAHHLALADLLPIRFEPFDQRAFLHVPAQPGHDDFVGHGRSYSASRSRTAAAMEARSGTMACSSAGL